jgi:hypothetical protein
MKNGKMRDFELNSGGEREGWMESIQSWCKMGEATRNFHTVKLEEKETTANTSQ